jgi:Zn-finger nucleic acid-binding protein
MTVAEALNCPNCGAAVSSDRSICEFCKSRLKTVACPACFGTMFLGAKFCTHCGANTSTVESLVEDAGKCPRCDIRLDAIAVGSVNLRECNKCGGMWMNADEFERVCGDRERQAAILARSAGPHSSEASVIKYVPCPDCGQLMNRSNFARASGVIIDLCRDHGVWFDADELPKIIEFINSGGLARSREKEKADIDAERSRLRDERARLEAFERRTGSSGFGDGVESRVGIGSFIRSLFDI